MQFFCSQESCLEFDIKNDGHDGHVVMLIGFEEA